MQPSLSLLLFGAQWVNMDSTLIGIQFTGEVPTYGLLDLQVTKNMKKQNLAIKIGASNILNNRVLQVYGGPFIGRMAYISLSFDFKD